MRSPATIPDGGVIVNDVAVEEPELPAEAERTSGGIA
jgi:hypothetical protein